MKKHLFKTMAVTAAVMGFSSISAHAEEVVITIPTYMVGENVGKAYFDGCVARYNEMYAGKYRIEIEEVPEATYTDKIRQMVQSGQTPILAQDLNKTFVEDIVIPNELYYPMNDFVESHPDVIKWALPGSVETCTLENGDIICVPLPRVSYVGLFANTSQYDAANNPGEMTMDEFLGTLEDQTFAFQTVNNAWTSGLFLTSIIANEEGGKEFLQQNEGTYVTDWNQDCLKKSVEKLYTVWKEHAASNSLGADYPDAINAITSNNATFITNGSWMNAQIQAGNEANWSNGFDGADMAAYAFPGNYIIAAQKAYGRWFMFNTGTKEEQEAALAFLELTYTQYELEQWLLNEGGGITTMDYSEEFLAEISKSSLLSQQTAAMSGESVELIPNILDLMPASVSGSTFGNLLSQLVTDQITIDQFCEQMTIKTQEALEE